MKYFLELIEKLKDSFEYKEQLDIKNKEYEKEIKKLKNDYDLQLSAKSEEFKQEMNKKDLNHHKLIEQKNIGMKNYQEIIKNLNEENKSNIKKFEEYLIILEKRISFVNNEKFVKIFDEDFVKAKKEYCKIIFEGKVYELQENFDVNNITNKNSELLEINIIPRNNQIFKILNIFYKCTSLLYLPDISKFDTSNFHSMCDMFACMFFIIIFT